MDKTIIILLVIALLIAVAGIILLCAMLIVRSEKSDKIFKDAVISANKESFEASNNTNMRLISLLTELTTLNPPLTAAQVNEHMMNVKAQDDEIVKAVLNDEHIEPFDPYKVSQEESAFEEKEINDLSAVYHDVNQKEK